MASSTRGPAEAPGPCVRPCALDYADLAGPFVIKDLPHSLRQNSETLEPRPGGSPGAVLVSLLFDFRLSPPHRRPEPLATAPRARTLSRTPATFTPLSSPGVVTIPSHSSLTVSLRPDVALRGLHLPRSDYIAAGPGPSPKALHLDARFGSVQPPASEAPPASTPTRPLQLPREGPSSRSEFVGLFGHRRLQGAVVARRLASPPRPLTA